MNKKIIAGIAAFTMAMGLGGGIAYAKNTDNDKVLRGDRAEYTEYFKQDSAGGRKNYLYTATDVPAPKPGHCLVVTGDSEQTIAIACNNGQG